jgi:hypothetical protein
MLVAAAGRVVKSSAFFVSLPMLKAFSPEGEMENFVPPLLQGWCAQHLKPG